MFDLVLNVRNSLSLEQKSQLHFKTYLKEPFIQKIKILSSFSSKPVSILSSAI